MDRNEQILTVVLIGAAAWAWWVIASDDASQDGDEGERGAGGLLSGVSDVVTKGLLKVWVPPGAAGPYVALIHETEDRNGIPRNMLARLLWQESRFREDIITGRVKSAAGAIGIAQFMPATAKELRINPLNPAEAIPAAGRYLSGLYARFGTWQEALAAYNWGQGNVSRKGLDKAPAETRAYWSSILADLGLS